MVTVGIGTVAVVLILAPSMTCSPDLKPLDPAVVPPKSKAPMPDAAPPDPTVPGRKGHGSGTGHGPAPRPERIKVVESGGMVDLPVKTPRPIETDRNRADAVAGVIAVDAALDRAPRMTKTGGALTAATGYDPATITSANFVATHPSFQT